MSSVDITAAVLKRNPNASAEAITETIQELIVPAAPIRCVSQNSTGVNRFLQMFVAALLQDPYFGLLRDRRLQNRRLRGRLRDAGVGALQRILHPQRVRCLLGL